MYLSNSHYDITWDKSFVKNFADIVSSACMRFELLL